MRSPWLDTVKLSTCKEPAGWYERAIEGPVQIVAACINKRLDDLIYKNLSDHHDGVLTISLGSRLGIEVDTEKERCAATESHSWRYPAWCHAGGSFAKW